MVRGTHRRTFPGIKDLFVHDRDGIFDRSRFRAASQVFVHLVTLAEFNGVAVTPVANFNRGSHSLTIPQHGLVLVVVPDSDPDVAAPGAWGATTDAATIPAPGLVGPPGFNGQVKISLTKLARELQADFEAETGATIASMPAMFRRLGTATLIRLNEFEEHVITHELGHGISLQHHSVTPVPPPPPVLAAAGLGERACYMRYHHNDYFVVTNYIQWHANITLGSHYCALPDNCASQPEVADR